MKAIRYNSHITESLSCILNMFLVMDLSSTLFNTSCGKYSILKESKYAVVFLPIDNETRCVSFNLFTSRLITYNPSPILDKLSLKITPLSLGSLLKHLVISMLLKVWSRTKTFYPFYYNILFLLSWLIFQKYLLPINKFQVLPLNQSKVLTKQQKTHLPVIYFMFHYFINSIK